MADVFRELVGSFLRVRDTDTAETRARDLAIGAAAIDGDGKAVLRVAKREARESGETPAAILRAHADRATAAGGAHFRRSPIISDAEFEAALTGLDIEDLAAGVCQFWRLIRELAESDARAQIRH